MSTKLLQADEPEMRRGVCPPGAPDARAKAWLGVLTRVDDGRLLVSGLLRGTPAYGSGLATDDELIAIDDFRLDGDGLDARIEQYQPGAKVELLVSRRGELRRVGLTLGRAPTDRWLLSVRPDATPEQQQRLTAWMGPVAPGTPTGARR